MTIDWHAACRSTLKETRDAIKWINSGENETTVGVERKPLDRSLRRLVTEATKLDKAVDRPMCVGVFGPSQAGKSYLVSVLARKGSAPLMARFGGESKDYDFVAEINPGGDRESTGLVTRFSLRDLPAPEGYPVCLRLLTESDLVKVIANTYFLDGDPKTLVPISQDELLETFVAARAVASDQSSEVNQLTPEDIWDIQEYCEKTFEGTRSLEALRGFWDEASVLAPRLSFADRADLFSVIWGRVPEFTAIYRELTEALAKLKFTTDAFCPMDALLPRSDSIIDVETLSGLGKPDQPELKIRAASGVVVSLPRPVVTALVAELHITITEKPWPFFTHTDLLDFPGARSRQPVDFSTYMADVAKNPIKETFLRGKIAYLFDRYVADQELNSMLLCIPDSVQEVTALPEMIDHWISITHGQTPLERVGKTVVLFFILTKFDRHFTEKAGEEGADPGERFASRLHSSIDSFFGNQDWPNHWTPDQPFNNCFWLRNPNFKSEFMIEYDGRNEVKFLSSKTKYIADLKQGYLQVPAVKAHFSDPERSFDETLKLNDGGVTFLAENLAPICREELKFEQIETRLQRLRDELVVLLSPFYVDSDVAKRLDERRAVSQEILGHVQRLGGERRFADLVNALQVSQQTFAGVLYDAYSRRSTVSGDQEKGNTENNSQPTSAPISNVPPLPGMPPLPGVSPTPSGSKIPGKAPAAISAANLSQEAYLARAAIEYWLGTLRASAEADHLSRFFGGDSKIVMELVNEISNAARREQLDQKLANKIALLSGGLNEEIDLFLEKAVFVSCALINGFVSRFGFDELAESERPTAPNNDGEMRPVFRQRVAANSARQIDPAHFDHHFEMMADWMYALHATVENNAKSVDGLDLDLEQNALIGAILTALRQTLHEIGVGLEAS